MPSISMDVSANYVTQTSTYSRLIVGKPLTDRRITALKKKGWFGSGILSLQRKEKVAKTKKRLKLSDII